MNTRSKQSEVDQLDRVSCLCEESWQTFVCNRICLVITAVDRMLPISIRVGGYYTHTRGLTRLTKHRLLCLHFNTATASQPVPPAKLADFPAHQILY